jgi:hypothetical protein
MSPYAANQAGGRAYNFLNDLTPVGSAVSAQQAGQDYRQGNYLGALGNGAMAALGMLPDFGAVTGKVAHSIIAPLFHGSPHKFEKFALEKIGTGEGAQAYGHGLYFAENPAVARDYQMRLTPVGQGDQAYQLVQNALERTNGDITAASHLLHNEALALPPSARRAHFDAVNNIDKLAQGPGGHLYEVSLDANPEDFLNWDAPLYKQSKQIQSALGVQDASANLAALSKRYDDALYRALQGDMKAEAEAADLLKQMKPYREAEKYGQQVVRGSSVFAPENAAQIAADLNRKGIPGIRYLDQGSRTAGKGTHNYVVFDPSIIDILNRN